MDYIVTARKWRPQTFEEVVGQQHITQTLKNAVLNKRVAHAYIFTGPRGVGKTTSARIMAKSLNCLSPEGAEPCNKCDMCNSFNTSQSMDVIEIDGASNRRIEDIRTLRESVKYAPTSGQYKIYIIDEVHMLTTESFNALLKTLEEPPEHTIFIFATTDIHKVPLTIISRCQRFDFRRIELNTIKSLLQKIATAENISIDDESLTIIAKKADGALRDAESLFDQVIAFCGKDVQASVLRQMLNFIDDDIYFQVSDAILNKDFSKAFDIPLTIYKNGWNYIDFINGLNEHFRNILSVIISQNNLLIDGSEIVKENYLKYKNQFSEGDLVRILSYTNQLANEIRTTSAPKLKVEISLSQLIGFERTSTITELLKQVKSGVNTSINTEPFREDEKKNSIIKPERVIENKTEKVDNSPISSDKDIIKDWESFTSLVAQKKMSLGIIKDCKPMKIEKEKIYIECTNHYDADILELDKETIEKLFFSFFNFKMKFFFIKAVKSEEIQTDSSTDDGNNSPLVEAIIKELGGKKISS